MNNLITRTLSGAVFVAILIAAILINNPLFFGVVFLLIAIASLNEFCQLSQLMPGISVNKPLLMAASLLFILYEMLPDTIDHEPFAGIAIFSIVLLPITELFRKKENPVLNWAMGMGAVLYIGLGFSSMAYIENQIHPICLLAFFVIIWGSDTGAYLVGRCIGKHKFFERISPKKTWEGILGGAVFAIVLVSIICYFQDIFGNLTEDRHWEPLSYWQWLLFALTVFVSETLGDLVESQIKRSVAIKDSGKFLPGHGGALDRMDSAIIAAPIAAALLTQMID